MNSPPILTKRLKIVSFSKAHLTSQYVSWLNDPEVVRYSEQRQYHHTIESCRIYYESFQESPNFLWAIEVNETHQHIGNINVYIDKINLVADLGIMIGERSVWGKGYGTEAWKAVCDYFLTKAKMRKVTAGTLSVNLGMLAIMERTGMIPDGKRVRQCLFERMEVDVIHTALFRD